MRQLRQLIGRLSCTTAVVMVVLGACAGPAGTSRPSATASTATLADPITSAADIPVASVVTSPAVITAASTSTTTVTVSSSTATLAEPGPLEFVDGRFLGISQGTLLPDAVTALGVAPVPLSELDQSEPVYACTGTPDPWVIRSGGLTLVFEAFEDASADTASLTNWRYVGGPVAGFTEMVAPRDIRVGDARAQVEAAYPRFTDLGSEIRVTDPTLGFGLEGDRVAWFGIIDCVMEPAPPD